MSTPVWPPSTTCTIPWSGNCFRRARYDVALTISDAMFAADGSLGYDDNSDSGLWGDVILVNGRPWPVMKVQKRIYRFRVLNACISRSLRPTLSHRGDR